MVYSNEARRLAAQRYRQNNKEALKARHIDDVKNNPEKYKKRRAAQRACKPFEYKLLSIKGSAKKRGIEFDLMVDDIRNIWTGVCPVFGTEIEIGQKVQWGRQNYNSPHLASLDRIDSSRGYVKGNIQWVSNLVNLMKTGASPEQLVMFAAWISKCYPK